MRSILIIAVIFFAACDNNHGNRPGSPGLDTAMIVSQKAKARPAWTDSLIMNYIHRGGNEMIRMSVEYKLNEEWIFDREETHDGVKYHVFQIGHDVSEQNGTNMRFVTDGW